MLKYTGNAKSGTAFSRLQAEVIHSGLCTHCGTCAGLSDGTLEMEPTPWGPIPTSVRSNQVDLPPAAFEACPGKGINYPNLFDYVFGQQPRNWLIGCYRSVHIGYSLVPEIRRRGASGGVITQALIYLLEQGLIDGAVVVRQGLPKPWQAQPILAQSVDEIIAASQSVYVPIPVNTVLPQMESFNGRLAYVGLPDQVASLRCLQRLGHSGAQKVDYVLGPYVGTSMYFGAIESYLRSHGIHSLDEIAELRYREGEWPGYLQVKTRSGQVLRAAKFYYNYLIPFYITRSTLYSVDFTNELTDISVGDAWHPRYEAQGTGFSIVVTRSEKGENVLRAMYQQGLLNLEEISLNEALSMHGHMLDFKKRGAFIRMRWRVAFGKRVPDYGYQPKTIPFSRKLVEMFINLVLIICSTHLARRVVEFVPLGIIGPVFNMLRKAWKSASKPTKRKNLGQTEFEVNPPHFQETT
jgi:coenzyme F420 hydrogenase subunit beta